MSGGGTKAGGHDYLLNFMFPRVVTENTVRRGFAPDSGEAGVPGLEVRDWQGILGPRGMPNAVTSKLNAELAH